MAFVTEFWDTPAGSGFDSFGSYRDREESVVPIATPPLPTDQFDSRTGNFDATLIRFPRIVLTESFPSSGL